MRTRLLLLVSLLGVPFAQLACGDSAQDGLFSPSSSASSSSSSTGGGGGAGTTSSSVTTSSASGGGDGGSAGVGGGGASGEGGAGGAGEPCTWSADGNPCGAGRYCDAVACGAGTCVPVGDIESQDRAPVCGCDGVTHWNASVAASNGVPVRASGACVGGSTCGGFVGLMCPDNAFCNRQVNSGFECAGGDQTGDCWRLPARCDNGGPSTGAQTRACRELRCVSECELVRSERPWYSDPTCM